MTDEELDEAQKEAENWVSQRWGADMPASQCRGMAKTVLKLVATVRAYDLERKTYYDGFKLVKEDWNQISGIKPVLPLLDEVFFNTDGDPDFSKFMAAEQVYRKFRGK
jgi:hypothetical protein